MQPNMTQTARAVQAQGRGDDTMLVHMTPGEVGGLQALAMANGGSLTINPQTGLPEAGFLKNLLPTLIGAGLMLIPGVNAVGAGLITGGIEAARTGDIGKGFLAGLGAFGGANLAGGLMSAGTAAASAAAPTATTAANVGANVGEASLSAMTPTQQLTTGAQNIFSSGQTGEAARTAFMGNVGGYGGLATDVGMIAAPSLLQQPEYGMPQAPKEESSSYTGPYTPTQRRVSYPTDEERRRSSEFTYFTPSNPVPFERGGSVPQLEDGGFVLTKKAVDGLGKGSNKKGQENARRGLGAIPIKGPGTGTSDSIKTTIDGKRPALVSNGEAYVPKRQVAKRGGAKAFYALMNKAEKAADKRKRA